MSASQVIQQIRDAGFGVFEKPIIDALLPCVRFAKAKPPGVGGSKLDGAPDLPAGTKWPEDVNGKPLAFLAQFNLAECAVDSPQWRMPRTGLLSFFYDAEDQPWGIEAGDISSWRVLYHDGAAEKNLETIKAPKSLSKEFVCGATGLKPIAGLSLPTLTTIAALKTPLAKLADAKNERLHSGYCDLLDSLNEPTGGLDPSPQLGGWPAEEQGSMPEELTATFGPAKREPPRQIPNPFKPGQMMTVRSPAPQEPPAAAKALLENLEDWRLLLQLPSTDDWCWGDMGKLYFWMAGKSLAERRFDETWMILQCG